MAFGRKEPDEGKSIFKDRYRECPHCRKYGQHRFAAHPLEDVWVCDNCGFREVIPTKKAEKAFKGLTAEEREKARQEILSVAGDLTTHKWGNMGKKDKSFVERMIDKLFGIARDIDR